MRDRKSSVKINTLVVSARGRKRTPARTSLPTRIGTTSMGVHFDAGVERKPGNVINTQHGAVVRPRRPRRSKGGRRGSSHTAKRFRSVILTAAVLAAFAAFGQFGSDVFFVEDARRTGPLIIESAASPTPAVSDVPNTALVGNSPAAALVAVAPTSLPKITPVVMPATPEPVEAPETVFQTPRASPSESAVKTEAQADNTSAQASEEARVWIPQSGSRYHANQNCSGMQNPKETTIEDAKQQGFSPCLRCKPPE